MLRLTSTSETEEQQDVYRPDCQPPRAWAVQSSVLPQHVRPETTDSHDDQIHCHYDIQHPWDDQDQKPGNKRDQRLKDDHIDGQWTLSRCSHAAPRSNPSRHTARECVVPRRTCGTV